MIEKYTDLDDIYAISKIIGYGEIMSTNILMHGPLPDIKNCMILSRSEVAAA